MSSKRQKKGDAPAVAAPPPQPPPAAKAADAAEEGGDEEWANEMNAVMALQADLTKAGRFVSVLYFILFI